MIPSLPPAPLPAPPFSLGRLRVTSQRLYLAVQPAYGPFFSTLARLATWKDRSQSLLFCAMFWTLWWYNLLLPALFLRTFYALIRRKIFSYPTVRELRERRAEVARASVFGDEVQARLMPSSPFGLTELWRIFKVFNKPKVDKAKDVIKESSNAKGKGKYKDSTSPEKTDSQPTREAPTVLDGSEESSLDTDSKRAILQSMAEIADLHERVKNIAIWRRPASSYFYSGIVLSLAILTFVLPAKYIAKLGCAIGGFMFWHVTPVLAAMSAADRSRMPPALDDVPTDSDYAMDLISQRVASGLHVKPTPLQRSKRTKMRSSETGGDDTFSVTSKEVKSIDWKRWGDRAALGKAAFARTPFGKATLGPAWSDDEKRLYTGTDWRQTGTWPPRNPLIPASILLHGAPTPRIETHTFPAHGKAGPGLITVTSSTLYFTPLISASAIITIPFSDLRGIKKTGILKGLSIRWTETEGASTEKEEKFMWVGDRDELFARLIGPGGRRWLKV
ncbi:hypothetical protein FIBSPDRAFT_49641 [Athelia psychrophila]|uniref:Uncharacterized protein n=1 Tax=Athelia psychrophila TaxID=1759441 RepID=A0A166U6J7_9AGAM|nr:hypothetical protein FIBSPDRAFT_49641 [Fibularhizoctonia sp. CBS 109695]